MKKAAGHGQNEQGRKVIAMSRLWHQMKVNIMPVFTMLVFMTGLMLIVCSHLAR